MRNQPTLSPSSTLPIRAYLAATYTPAPPSPFFDFHPTHRLIRRVYHRAFLLFIPLGERTTEILVSDNREPNSICNHRRWRAASSLSSSTTAEFPWKSSLETELHGVSYLFDEVDIFSSARKGNRRGPLHPRVYIHLENSSVNSGACSLEIGYERERFYRGREGDLSFGMRIRRVLGGDFFLWIDFFFWSSINRKMRLSVY